MNHYSSYIVQCTFVNFTLYIYTLYILHHIILPLQLDTQMMMWPTNGPLEGDDDANDDHDDDNHISLHNAEVEKRG